MRPDATTPVRTSISTVAGFGAPHQRRVPSYPHMQAKLARRRSGTMASGPLPGPARSPVKSRRPIPAAIRGIFWGMAPSGVNRESG